MYQSHFYINSIHYLDIKGYYFMSEKEWFELTEKLCSILWDDLDITFIDGCCLGYLDHCGSEGFPRDNQYHTMDEIINDVDNAFKNHGYKTDLNHKFKEQKPYSILVNDVVLVSFTIEDSNEYIGELWIDYYNAKLDNLKEDFGYHD